MEENKLRRGPLAFRFSHVSFSYGSFKVLEDVSFHIHEGEFCALVGANGAGKTTILKLLLGLERPSSGIIELFPGLEKKKEELLGYVPQSTAYDPSFPIPVKDVVKMGCVKSFTRFFSKEEMTAAEEAMDLCDIQDIKNRPYAELSGGQRRRVLAARALASRPKLLVLDEPTVNMDLESEQRLFKTLKLLKGSTTILIVTHDSGFVSSLTDVVLCAGERNGMGQPRTVVRHRTSSVPIPHSTLYGGEALQVLHDETVPDSYCCEEKEAE
ncbi:MAG TPA: metal ABC transporter ATP-binding protein [Treponemataceae bacterium]|nr:metal ABC transporter ATP-binding protein [Treponemataceae bacterium]